MTNGQHTPDAQDDAIEIYEAWLDDHAGVEPWPPTRESWGRFCASDPAAVGAVDALATWEGYASKGFSTVDQNGVELCC